MNFRSLACSCLFAVIIIACGNQNNSVKAYIKNADSVSIAFYKNGTTSQIIIRDKASVEKLSEYIDGKTIAPLKCEDTGSIWFYEGGKKKMQVDFSVHTQCGYFSYMMNDKIYTKNMTDEAAQYLNSVEEIAVDTL